MCALHSTLQGSDLHGCKGIQYAEDLNTFNSHSWHNSGVQWNETAAKWIAKPSSAAGGGTYDSEADLTAVLNDNYAGSSQAAGRYYPSSLGKSLMNFSANKSLYANSANVRSRFAPSSLTDTRLDSIFNFSANKSIYTNSANVRSRFTASSNLNITMHTATSGSLHKLWTWSSNKSWYANSSNVRSRFPASSTAISRFRASSAAGSSKWAYVSSARISANVMTSAWLTTFSSNLDTRIDAITTKPSYWSSQSELSAGGIYYYGGEVVIAPSGTDYGAYRLQVSGASFFSGNVKFIGEMSGLADPTYASGVVNKHYADSTFAWSSNVRYRFPASSTAISKYRQSSAAGSASWKYVSSQNVSGGALRTTSIRNRWISSQGKISGQWWTPLYPTKPTPTDALAGQIIRTSGNANGTWVWICINSDATTWQWNQITYAHA